MNLFRIASCIDPRIEPVSISSTSDENDTWVPLVYEIKENDVKLENLELDEEN